MERKKSDGILYIFEALLSGSVVNKKELANRFNTSTKTIERYINDIRSYYINENKQEFVRYSRKEKGYILESNGEYYLSKEDVLAISKVLLESRGFIKEEIQTLVRKLLHNCIYKDIKHIEQVIGNELYHYVSPKHSKNLIKKIWDLSEAINRLNVIRIEYFKVGSNGKIDSVPTKRVLEPQGLLFSEHYFYLLSNIEGKKYKNPSIYRLDRINKYEILDRRFEVRYKDRFEDGEFRKRIQFMQSGKLEKIKFIFKGQSIEAVLDRLPTAKYTEESPGEYLVEVQSFDRGLKMWILSQGSSIEVLEPKEFKENMKNTIKKMYEMYRRK